MATAGFWGFIFELVLKFIGWRIDKNAEAKELKRQFLAFVDVAEQYGMVSVRLNESDRDQMLEIRKKRLLGPNNT